MGLGAIPLNFFGLVFFCCCLGSFWGWGVGLVPLLVIHFNCEKQKQQQYRHSGKNPLGGNFMVTSPDPIHTEGG